MAVALTSEEQKHLEENVQDWRKCNRRFMAIMQNEINPLKKAMNANMKVLKDILKQHPSLSPLEMGDGHTLTIQTKSYTPFTKEKIKSHFSPESVQRYIKENETTKTSIVKEKKKNKKRKREEEEEEEEE